METGCVQLRFPSQETHSLYMRKELKDLVSSQVHRDTLLCCSDGSIHHNRFTVWLLFPWLDVCPTFLSCHGSTTTILLPDFTVTELSSSFVKLLGLSPEISEETSLDCVPTECSNIDTEEASPQPTVSSEEQIDKSEIHDLCEDLLNSNSPDKFSDCNPSSYDSGGETDNICCDTVVEEGEDKTSQKCDTPKKGSRSAKKSYEGEILPGSHPYKCTYCDKKFKQVGHANLHERTHTGDKKYICPFCNKKFNQLSHLKDHERIHTGEKPFMCSDCGKCFGYNSALKSHKKIHTGEKSYKCGFCEKTFNQLGNLRTHERLHTGELKYMCTECGKCYNTRSNLGRHVCHKTAEMDGSPLPVGSSLQPMPQIQTHYLHHKLLL